MKHTNKTPRRSSRLAMSEQDEILLKVRGMTDRHAQDACWLADNREHVSEVLSRSPDKRIAGVVLALGEFIAEVTRSADAARDLVAGADCDTVPKRVDQAMAAVGAMPEAASPDQKLV